MKRLSFLFLILILVGCNTQHSENQIVLESPFVHSVYFWFKEDVTEEQKKEFFTETEKLRAIEVVEALYTGASRNHSPNSRKKL